MTHLPKIIIRTIDPDNQRYPTCGDWQYDAEDNTLIVSVNRMADFRSELAVAIHEMYESVMCLHDDITTTDVDQFDFQFEADRDLGKHTETEEAGDHPKAPYFQQHQSATRIERLTCDEMKLDWDTHDKNVNE